MNPEEIRLPIIPNFQHSEGISNIAKALCKALPKVDAAKKDSTNPAFRSKYADLTSIVEAYKEELAQVGIVVMQPPSVGADGSALVTTILLHESGEWMASALSLKPVKTDPQGMGSAITYARRYGAQGMLGITADDDDGNAASGTGSREQQQQVAQQRVQQLRKPVMPEVDAHPPEAEAEAKADAYAGKWADARPERDMNRWRNEVNVTPLDVAELASAKNMDATKKAKPSVSFEMLEAFKVVKSELAKITGSDSKYYDLLGGFGYEKSSQIPTRELGQKVYKALNGVLTTLKRDRADREEVAELLLLKPGAWDVCKRHGYTAETISQIPNDELGALLVALREIKEKK